MMYLNVGIFDFILTNQGGIELQHGFVLSACDLLLLCSLAGTGKTVTGAHIACHFVKTNRQLPAGRNRQVLYCAPSNEAVDLVTSESHYETI